MIDCREQQGLESIDTRESLEVEPRRRCDAHRFACRIEHVRVLSEPGDAGAHGGCARPGVSADRRTRAQRDKMNGVGCQRHPVNSSSMSS